MTYPMTFAPGQGFDGGYVVPRPQPRRVRPVAQPVAAAPIPRPQPRPAPKPVVREEVAMRPVVVPPPEELGIELAPPPVMIPEPGVLGIELK